MAKFRATSKGYFGDVIHDPATNHHVIFDAPEDFQCSWAERVDGKVPVEKVVEVSDDTLAAEALLETEADAGIPDLPEAETVLADDDDIPAEADAEPEDVNEAAGVEVL